MSKPEMIVVSDSFHAFHVGVSGESVLVNRGDCDQFRPSSSKAESSSSDQAAKSTDIRNPGLFGFTIRLRTKTSTSTPSIFSSFFLSLKIRTP